MNYGVNNFDPLHISGTSPPQHLRTYLISILDDWCAWTHFPNFLFLQIIFSSVIHLEYCVANNCFCCLREFTVSRTSNEAMMRLHSLFNALSRACFHHGSCLPLALNRFPSAVIHIAYAPTVLPSFTCIKLLWGCVLLIINPCNPKICSSACRNTDSYR